MRSQFRIPMLMGSVALLLLAIVAAVFVTGEIVLGRESDRVVVAEGQEMEAGQTISVEEAIAAAQGVATGAVDDVEIERRGDLLVFDIEVGSTDVVVNAHDGSIVAVEEDRDDDHDNRRNDELTAAEIEGLIVVEDAIAAARNVASGIVFEVDLERENGLLVYEIEIGDHEVEVDATTGEVISVEIED
jgi:uncharacterized membrane protein YkoI